jgi:hypothetical protein
MSVLKRLNSNRKEVPHSRRWVLAEGNSNRVTRVRSTAQPPFHPLISEVSTNLEKYGSRENLEVSSAGFRHAATAKVSAERDEMLKSMGAPSFLDAMEVRFPHSPANFWNVLAAKRPTQRIVSSAGQ